MDWVGNPFERGYVSTNLLRRMLIGAPHWGSQQKALRYRVNRIEARVNRLSVWVQA